MKASHLFLLLAACLLTAGIFLYTRHVLLDENGKPVLFDDEDEFCDVSGIENEPRAKGRCFYTTPGVS